MLLFSRNYPVQVPVSRRQLLAARMQTIRVAGRDTRARAASGEIEERSEVKAGRLEPSGSLSVIKREEVKPAEKRDRAQLEEAVR